MAFHQRNKHQGEYDLQKYSELNDELRPFIVNTPTGSTSINFSNSAAIYQLNKSILFCDYGIKYWDFPKNYLCPPIPSRADYIHHLADLLALSNNGKIPKGSGVTVLDIGTGASCIYPIIGVKSYQWNFIASEIHDASLKTAQTIVDNNPSLNGRIELRKQANPQNIFKDIIEPGEFIDLTICNPPFHASKAEAEKASSRKMKNLNGSKEAASNFGGKSNELWCDGGEIGFIERMIKESKFHKKNVMWFSTLVSKHANVQPILNRLKNHGIETCETLLMEHGNKKSRFVVWSFLKETEREKWAKIKWK